MPVIGSVEISSHAAMTSLSSSSVQVSLLFFGVTVSSASKLIFSKPIWLENCGIWDSLFSSIDGSVGEDWEFWNG